MTDHPETNVPMPINRGTERSNSPNSKCIVITLAPLPDADKTVYRIIQGACENLPHEPAAFTTK